MAGGAQFRARYSLMRSRFGIDGDVFVGVDSAEAEKRRNTSEQVDVFELDGF